MKWLVLCLRQTRRPGIQCPRAGDMKVKKAGSLPSMELTLRNAATAGMLTATEAEGMVGHMTQWQEASCSSCQSHSSPKNTNPVLKVVGRNLLTHTSPDEPGNFLFNSSTEHFSFPSIKGQHFLHYFHYSS